LIAGLENFCLSLLEKSTLIISALSLWQLFYSSVATLVHWLIVAFKALEDSTSHDDDDPFGAFFVLFLLCSLLRSMCWSGLEWPATYM
jgi:hypothetical protein